MGAQMGAEMGAQMALCCWREPGLNEFHVEIVLAVVVVANVIVVLVCLVGFEWCGLVVVVVLGRQTLLPLRV